MKISEMNWMQVEEYLRHDDRAVVPLGSTEQHAYLSLSVDSILSERVAVEAADPLDVPVYPVISYGLTPYFQAFPGSISLRMQTYLRLIRDILDGLVKSGFRRIVLVNGHGGNSSAGDYATEWMADNPHIQVKLHNWWNAPNTWNKVHEIDPVASHASWMENYPWTRLPGITQPDTMKQLPDRTGMARLVGQANRDYLGDGNFAGLYQRPDEEMLALWAVAVEETRQIIDSGWD